MTDASNIFNTQLSTADRISKAKIQLHREYPFFSYLVEHLRMKEDNNLPIKTMCVDPKGTLRYDAEFVNKLTEVQLKSCLAHEVMHPAFRHFNRKGSRDVLINGYPLFWVACDVSINHILVEEGLSLPEVGIIPKNGEVTVYGIKISNIGDKMTEEIYEELLSGAKQQVKQGKMKVISAGNKGPEEMSNGGKSAQGFDDHKEDANGEGDEEKDGDGEGLEDNNDSGVPQGAWDRVVAEAMEFSKKMGKLPAGMQRQYDELHKSKINWRAFIRRTVASKIPFDYSYARPNRRYVAHDIYMPTVVGEKIKIICSIDTSGSITQDELTSFISEMIGIARSFAYVDFVVLTHDVEVHDDVKISDNTISKLKSLVVHGGGGTSHKPLFNYVSKNMKKWDCKLLVSFTDGHSVFPEKSGGVDTIFVLGGSHAPRENMPKWAKTICLD
jgi:predicted metal-dependent peptidase